MNFSEQENYKGAILEKGAKNGIAVNFSSRPVLDDNLLKFRSVCEIPSLGIYETSDTFPNKNLSERHAAFKALGTWNALDYTKTLEKKSTMERVELSKIQPKTERVPFKGEEWAHTHAKCGRWDKTIKDFDFSDQDSEDEDVPTDYKEEAEFLPFSALTMIGTFNPWEWKTEPKSVLKENLIKRFIDEYRDYDTFRKDKGMTHPDAIKEYAKQHPIMSNGVVAGWFSAHIIYFLWNDENRALAISKHCFGSGATKAMINPILYKCDFLRKDSSEMWHLKI